MSPTHYTKITLAERPTGAILPTTFKRERVPFDLQPGPKQILVKLHYVSLDPAMRGWLRDTRSYLPPVQIGEVMRAQALAEVVEAGPGSRFKKGDVVDGTFGTLRTSPRGTDLGFTCVIGWTEYGVFDDKRATKVE